MKRQSTIHHQRLEAVNDLVTLSPLSDDSIVSCIRERFLSDTIYTGISRSALVAVNPHKFVATNADSVLHKYAAEHRSISDQKEPLPPHIFQLANDAYYHMRRTTQDQSIILNGETGSGKSESRRLAIKTLLELRSAILARRAPSSRIRFPPPTWAPVRHQTLDYYLERNRVAGAPSGERNFHIFYYLFAGAAPEERQHMQLLDKTTFRYLGHRGIPGGRQNMRDDDAQRFEQLKRHVAQTCQLIAAILHLGNLEFTIDRARDVDAAVVRNQEVLALVAEFWTALSYKTKLVKKELCTVFLDPDGAADNRDDLAKTLYSLLFHGLMNTSTNASNLTSRPNSLDQFSINFANERLHNFVQKKLFESHVAEYNSEGISRFVPQVPYFDNSECLRLLQNQPGGLIHIMDDQARPFGKRWGNHSSFKVGSVDRSGFPTFTINHFNGPVTYSAEGFLERNLDAISPDFVSLLRGSTTGFEAAAGGEGSGSINPFVRGLFSGKAIATQMHPRNEDTIVAAQQPVKPMRNPSTRRKNTVRRAPTLGDVEEKERDDDDAGPTTLNNSSPCVAGEFRSALETLFDTLEETQSWYVFCVNPNDSQLPNQLEGRSVKGQIRSLGLTEIARRCVNVFEVGMTPREFCDRYREKLAGVGITEGESREQIERARGVLGLKDNDLVLGQYKVFLSHSAFHHLEDFLRSQDKEEIKRNRMREAEIEGGLDPRGTADPFAPYRDPENEQDPHTPYLSGVNDAFNLSNQALPLVANASPFQRADMYNEYDERQSLRSEEFDGRSRLTSARDDTMSLGTESYAPSRNMFQNVDKKALLEKEALPGEIHEGEVAEVLKETSARRRWVALCWLLTWWVPTPFLRWFGRMKRMDVRQAWREKLALNMLIWLMCASAVFVIAILGDLICPTEHNQPNNVYVAIRGEVFDLTQVAQTHLRIVPVVPEKSIMKYGGTIADDLFPVQVSALCNGVSGSVSPYVILNFDNNTDPNAQYHDFRGFIGYTPKEIRNMASSGKSVGIYRGLVYDVTNYLTFPPATRAPYGQQAPQVDTQFMDGNVLDVFKFNSGYDITKQLDNLNIDSNVLSAQKVCLRNLFTIGKVDNRNSPQCLFSTYILLALSVLMVCVIGFKFLASINFSAPRAPEAHDKFVICQVPCYTEGDASLRRTIDSLAQLKYDDKRKLLVVICDGMIVGSGNDKPTPRIVLDILGADPNQDPEPLSFQSLGEGAKQHNMGKVYSGLYETNGHVVPYMVLVKVGKPSERSRPGNRGKRDSQIMLMNFLNKVSPSLSSTRVEVYSLRSWKCIIRSRMSSVSTPPSTSFCSPMIHDKKLVAVCGETGLANAKQSIITMMQVYEYFISHHLAKAFESLFGSVTCLPGCFSLYRLRTPDTHKPLLVANQLVADYAENRVDTLHMKNLLHLGEDRYLTTLLLKHFAHFKTQFVRDAHAYTVAPDDWKVLLSQRRRWINSTVHNLGELMFLDRLCGFCCFSMRFIVMIDLLSTIIQPVSVAYIVYLVVLTAGEHKAIPTLSLILIAAVYGLQAFVFILRRKWDMVGWMIFYIIAIPAFSFLLPLYSFWRMDDFSWGQTRIVMGEAGKKMIVHDEGKFDPRSIPLKSWNDYENELWDKESNHSIGSWVPPTKLKNEGYPESRTSVYGRETYYDPRSFSPSPSQMGHGAYASPPGYQSGRNTPAMDGSQMYQSFSRPPTNYLDVAIPTTRSDAAGEIGGPSDAEIDHAVQTILRDADLNSITKREIRRKLEEHFASINAAIDRGLLSHA
ncbi:glycosyltransferase family 2 protein [Russula vinacea]|nr:glycosyltransferase family 2 protein [Russula vinacea]